MDRLTKENYENDLFEKQKDLIQIDEYTKICYSQHMYNEDLWKAVKEKEDLEEQIGCPLIVYVKIRQGMVENVYIQRFKMEKMWIGLPFTSNGFCAISGLLQQACFWKDYKKTWWLKEDKSE
jgi:hypothetical protein